MAQLNPVCDSSQQGSADKLGMLPIISPMLQASQAGRNIRQAMHSLWWDWK
jgi:hypothetical protein